MDLHHSTNQNLYLRHSYVSQTGLPRPNLESRIIYTENERSFNNYFRWILGALLLLLTLFLLKGFFWPSAPTESCSQAGGLSSAIAALKARLTGESYPSNCNLKKEITSQDSGSETVTTVREIRKCPLEGGDDSQKDGWSLWDWFYRKHPNCDKFTNHEGLLARIRSLIKPFSKIPPSLRDIQMFPSKYAQIRKYANETENPNLRSDVQFLFDEIDKERNWATSVHNRDISHPNFVAPATDLDFLMKLQLKAKELHESGRVLADKDATIDRLRNDFHGKTTEKDCADQLSELKRLYTIQLEKKAFSGGQLDAYRGQLRDIQLRIDEALKRKYKDEDGPMSNINKIEKELSAINANKMRVNAKIGDGDAGRIGAERSRLQGLEQRIRSNLAEISDIKGRNGQINVSINSANDRLKAILVELGTLNYKLNLSLRNSEIKAFLSSILRDTGSEKTLEQYFSETELTKKEIIQLVRRFLANSQGYNTVETNFSESEWTEAIEKDQQEFKEIMRVYHELRDMISKYKDVEINITAYKSGIAQKEKERGEAEGDLRNLQAKIKTDADRQKALEDDNDRLRLEIKALEGRIVDMENELARNKVELDRLDSELSAKLALKADLDLKHRVGLLGHDRRL